MLDKINQKSLFRAYNFRFHIVNSAVTVAAFDGYLQLDQSTSLIFQIPHHFQANDWFTFIIEETHPSYDAILAVRWVPDDFYHGLNLKISVDFSRIQGLRPRIGVIVLGPVLCSGEGVRPAVKLGVDGDSWDGARPGARRATITPTGAALCPPQVMNSTLRIVRCII